ncbi:MAG TPA: hypothetical protein VL132_18705 [Planctomycetaceae bacterium]|nr:hypothetical protein [Planctomycetaceae bacterium]
MGRACIRWLRQFVGAVLLLAFFVCAAEVALRVREVTQGGRDDGLDQKLAGIVSPSATIYASLRPFAEVRTRSSETQQPVTFRLNSYGCRGPEPVVPKPADTVRILCLGGDQLFGATTPEELHFCSLLQQYLQGRSAQTIEILNGAVAGGSPCTQYLRLKHELAALQPDYVLLEIDPVFLARGAALQRWMRSDVRGQPLTCCHPALMGKSVGPAGRRWREEFRVLDRLACLAGARLLGAETAGTDGAGGADEAGSLDVLPHLAALVQQWGGRVVVWSTPDLQQAPDMDAARLAQRVGPAVQESGIPWCDVTVLYREPALVRQWSLPAGTGWTGQGHQQLAEAVASFLLARVPGSWNGVYDRQTPVQPAVHQRSIP